MWAPSCRSTSSPLFVFTWTPTWLVIVPEGAYRAASLPSRSATYSSNRFTVGSSPKTSSPTGASSIARRIPSVGRVTVSLRRSITAYLHRVVRAPGGWWRSGSWPPQTDHLSPTLRPPGGPPPQRASRRGVVGSRPAPRGVRSPPIAAPAPVWTPPRRPRRPRPGDAPRAGRLAGRTAPDHLGLTWQTRPQQRPRPRSQVHLRSRRRVRRAAC